MSRATQSIAARQANDVDERPTAAPVSRKSSAEVVARKRQRILEEASALFHEKGYEIATLEMVAERLEVTKPFIYTYFRNKAEILASVCAVGIDESLAALDRVEHAPGTSVDRLRAALAEVASIIIDRMEYIVVYQREMKNLTKVDAQAILRARHEFDLRIARLVEECCKDGFVDLPDAGAMSVWMGGLLSWIPNCYRRGSRRSKESLVDQVVHACMRLIGLN